MLKGEITVFFSLILLLVLGLVGTCLESARAAGLQARTAMTAASSLQSAFAAYDRALWETYGLLFYVDRDRTGSGLSAEMLSYAEKNAGDAGLGADWFSFHPEQVLAHDVIYATDQHGRVFRQAVSEYMRSCGVGETARELFTQLNLTEASGKLTETGRQWQLRGGEEELSLKQLWEDYERLREEAAQAEAIPAEGAEDTAGISREAAEATVEGAMGSVQDILRYGLLSLVVEDVSAVSEEALGGEELPSSLPGEQREGADWVLQDDGWLDTLLFYEYILRYLDSYTSESDGGCQVEYVIAGKSSDRKNLSSVAMRLLGLRYLLNQSAALTDAEIRAEAEALALAAVGWTGIVPLAEGLTTLLLAALALGESLLDVRTLLAGGQVPLTKESGSWRLSLATLPSVLGSFSADTGGEEKGLSYQDYLRILLLLNSQESVIYRTMDVIQREICRTEADFRMSRCVYAAKAGLQVSAVCRFPFLPGTYDYAIRKEAEYGYQQSH